MISLFSRQINADIEELQVLVSTSKRDSVKQILQGHIIQLVQKQSALGKQIASTESSASSSNYNNLKSVTTFAWDQTKEHVKIYIDYDKESVDASAIKLDITSKRSFVLVFGNSKFVLTKLFADIDGSVSHFKTTKSKIVVYLKKVNERHWSTIKETAESLKKAVEEEKDELGDDPQAGLMKLMKKMYDEGDDDMKRTIAKSWYDTQNKKDGDLSMPPMPDL